MCNWRIVGRGQLGSSKCYYKVHIIKLLCLTRDECLQCTSAQTRAALERNLLLAGFVNTEVVESVEGVEIAKACTTSSVALNLVAVSHLSLSFLRSPSIDEVTVFVK